MSGKLETKDIESTKELFNLYQEEWNKSIHSMPLTDEICLQLLDCYFDSECKVVASSLLNICVHNPPCNGENEVEIITNNRKWCKGRGIKYKSKEFEENAIIIRELYKQSEKRKKKNTKKENLDLIERLNNLELELQIEQLGTKEKKEILKKEKSEDIDKNFEKKIEKLYKDIDSKKVLKTIKGITETLQNKKVKNNIEADVITITKKYENKVYNELKTDQIDDEKTEELNNTLNKMKNVLTGLDDRLKLIEKHTNQIDNKQDKILELAETINAREELEQYVNTWYKSKYGIMKKIVLAPLKALNIIVWKPAKHAFWIFFGKYFYLIWGMLMLILIMACCLTAYSYIQTNIPIFFNLMNESIIYILGLSARTGNYLSQLIFPIYKESLNILYSSTSSFIIQIKDSTISYLYELIMKIIHLIANTLSETITNKLSLW
jgi:hypothetical protein